MKLDDSIAQIVLLTLVGACVLAFFLFGRSRGYLLYLALAFCALALSLRLPSLFSLMAAVVALVGFILALIDGTREMKERLARHRQEQREREEAFAIYMEELARLEKETADKETPSDLVETHQ
mgnify:CR=1 FL=1